MTLKCQIYCILHAICETDRTNRDNVESDLSQEDFEDVSEDCGNKNKEEEKEKPLAENKEDGEEKRPSAQKKKPPSLFQYLNQQRKFEALIERLSNLRSESIKVTT